MKKFSLILTGIVAIMFVLCSCGFNGSSISIREIPNVEDWVASPKGVEVVVKCYIIDKPPADYSELRELAEKHIEDNLDHIVSADDHQTRYKCFFYRASKKMPWDWEEDDGYLSEDHIYHHTDDMIIAVYWTSEDFLREYHIMKKSDLDDNYGLILEKVWYEGTSILNEAD